MKQKFIDAYMDVAERFAQLSSAKRLQVGAIVVKNDRIISIGYNGMPTGWDNCCEYKYYDLSRDINGDYFPDPDNQYPYANEHGRYALKTKSEVLHAESNCIAKLARSPESGEGATIFITHSPCIDCAKLIYQSGIATVYYKHDYRSTQGVEFLLRSGIEVVKV
jgi:dCMP deaminase